MSPAGTGDQARSNVLLLVPGFRDDEPAICGTLLDVASDERVRAVLVACGESPASLLETWDEYVAAETVERIVINVEMLTRSTSREASADAVDMTGDTNAPRTRVETLEDPADFAEIGATIDGVLSGETDQSVLCFHSLTDLIQHLDTRDVFTFLEGLTDTVEGTDAVAHYHMDPTAHDPETIRTIEGLFDGTFDVREQ